MGSEGLGWKILVEMPVIVPAFILLIGAIHLYRRFRNWWIVHPRLSNGQAIPLTIMIIAYVLANTPFWWWGAPREIWWFMFVSCFMPLMATGAYRLAVWVKTGQKLFHDGAEYVEEIAHEAREKLGFDDDHENGPDAGDDGDHGDNARRNGHIHPASH